MLHGGISSVIHHIVGLWSVGRHFRDPHNPVILNLVQDPHRDMDSGLSPE